VRALDAPALPEPETMAAPPPGRAATGTSWYRKQFCRRPGNNRSHGGTMKLAILSTILLTIAARADEAVHFDWFEYAGRDATFANPPPAGSFSNPVLAGYFPDPSVVRVGGKYYLVNSTFAHFPGIPVHESSDLVHWRLIGHVLNEPARLAFDGLDISRGVFAPSINYRKGIFYVLNTLVDAGGNYFVTATNPAGPWSEPTWLKELDGIDPAFFFDADGKAYIVYNGPPAYRPLYEGHRAIWMQEYDLAARKLVGPRRVLVDGGTDIARQPIWIEGPHLYRIKGHYYLMCAEGGTGANHSEVVFRARSPWGPFEPYAGNPILTQRDLAAQRAEPITNAGHADLVQMQDGSWWSVFLASRPYQGERYNTGRETFLLPVSWKDGWPVILDHGRSIPYTLAGPRAMASPGAATGHDLLAGNFRVHDDFDGANLRPEWLQIYAPTQKWFELAGGNLSIQPLRVNLDAQRNASFLARRQQHLHFDASTQLAAPTSNDVAAGLAVYQSGNAWYFLGTRRVGGALQVFLERHAASGLQLAASREIALSPTLHLRLRVSGDGGSYSFYYDSGQGWQPLRENDDASILSSAVAGGFVGTVLGPYARQE
jgi:alpha-N-arabinofuranosidase